MRCLRLLSLTLALGLTACFLNHPQLIGSAEKVQPGQWGGDWVAQSNSEGKEQIFHVKDVDPARGIFEIQNADSDDNKKFELHLRRVGKQLFLDMRHKPEELWMLFVVEEATPEKIVLAWQPSAASFEAAIARGDFKAKLSKYGDDNVAEVAFTEMSEKEAEMLAENWRELYLDERITLKRLVVAD